MAFACTGCSFFRTSPGHPRTACQARWPLLDAAGAIGSGIVAGYVAATPVRADCASTDDSCFDNADDRDALTGIWVSSAAAFAVGAVYGLYRIGQCSTEPAKTEEPAVVQNELPDSCRTAAEQTAEDRFMQRATTSGTTYWQQKCVRDQFVGNQQAWYAQQAAQIKWLEQQEYERLTRENVSRARVRQTQDEQPPPKPTAPEAVVETPVSISFGSCFFVSPDGIAVTNQHVVDGARRIYVIDASATKHKATVLRASSDIDLVALDVPTATKHAYAPIDTNPKLNLGQSIFTIGFPLPPKLGFDPKYSDGAVAGLKGLGDEHLLQMTTPIQPGNSGGAVSTDFGVVVGVVVAKLNSFNVLRDTGSLPENVNFAIKSAELAKLLRGISLPPPKHAANRSDAIARIQAAACQVIAFSSDEDED